MPAHRFHLLNVFTHEHSALTGNPLCVFEDGAGIETATMQALALQFNLSETTFLLPSSRATARVRIFTPGYEMPFAGHPTLGTAHVCRAMGLGGDDITLEMSAGLVPVRAVAGRWTLTAPADPTWRDLTMSREALADHLGLAVADLDERPLRVRTGGNEQLMVPVKSAEAVRRAAPPITTFAGLKNDRGASNAHVFAPDGDGRLLARYFFAQGGSVREDPATGSAAANLGVWWLAMDRTCPAELAIFQGAQTGRPSLLFLDIGTDGAIRVSGDVIEIGTGTLNLN